MVALSPPATTVVVVTVDVVAVTADAAGATCRETSSRGFKYVLLPMGGKAHPNHTRAHAHTHTHTHTQRFTLGSCSFQHGYS